MTRFVLALAVSVACFAALAQDADPTHQPTANAPAPTTDAPATAVEPGDAPADAPTDSAVLDWSGSPSASEAETALIRAASADEKIEPYGNAAVRIFVNPAGRGSTATLLKIVDIGAKRSETLKSYGAVRVAPGRYLVQGRCSIFPFVLKREIEIEAVAGNQYLIECAGHTGHTTRLIVHRIEK